MIILGTTLCYVLFVFFSWLLNMKWGPAREEHLTRLHLLGKVARMAFAQESLKTMTSPTSARKTPTKSFKSWCPQDAHQVMISPGLLTFCHTFFHIKICLRTGSRGTPHFSIFFNARLGYLKQYCIFQCPKSGPNWWRRRTPDGRTNRRTSKFWGLLHKSPSGKKVMPHNDNNIWDDTS